MHTRYATRLTNGRAESDDIPIRVGDRSLPLAIILVPRAVHFEPRLSPLFRYLVGVLTVDIQHSYKRFV